jgi:signal transduction histidine kinase
VVVVDAAELRLQIANDPPSEVPATLSKGGGHGAVGMRERVGLYGGRLEAGRRPDGGYLVEVHLPLGVPA